ncbi:hypothetical protein [Halopiger djelfimassiliensis]|nr:hypothetical protein [Halopiger djelfimassiliensis]
MTDQRTRTTAQNHGMTNRLLTMPRQRTTLTWIATDLSMTTEEH